MSTSTSVQDSSATHDRSLANVYFAAKPTLLGLPVEVRQEILKYLLCSSTQLDYFPDAIIRRLNGVECEYCGDDPRDCDCDPDPEDDESGSSEESDNETSIESDTEASGQQAAKVPTTSKDPAPHKGGGLSTREGALKFQGCKDSADEVSQHSTEVTEVLSSRYRLSGQILRVCRQLHEEGKALLWHRKNVGVVYHIFAGDPEPRGHVLGQKSIETALKNYVPGIRQVKLWHFTIFLETTIFRYFDKPGESYALRAWKSRLYDDARALMSRHHSLECVDIEIRLRRFVEWDDFSEFDVEQLVHQVLVQLRELRAKVCRVSISGSSENLDRYIETAEKEITGTVTADQYDTMMAKLKKLVDTLTLCMYQDIWDYDGFEFTEPHKWFRYVPQKYFKVCGELPGFDDEDSIRGLFDQWSTAVRVRDVEALTSTGCLMLDRIDNYLRKQMQWLAKSWHGIDDDTSKDLSSLDSDAVASYIVGEIASGHDSWGDNYHMFNWVKELQAFSTEVRSCFMVEGVIQE